MSSNLITVWSCRNDQVSLPRLTKLTRAVCSVSGDAAVLILNTDSTKQYMPEGDAIGRSESAFSFTVRLVDIFGTGHPTSRTRALVEKMTRPTRAYSPFRPTPYAHRYPSPTACSKRPPFLTSSGFPRIADTCASLIPRLISINCLRASPRRSLSVGGPSRASVLEGEIVISDAVIHSS